MRTRSRHGNRDRVAADGAGVLHAERRRARRPLITRCQDACGSGGYRHQLDERVTAVTVEHGGARLEA